MKAMVMDGCVIESNAMLAAGAVLTPGKRVKTGELWAGTPAKLMREMKPAEWDMITATVDHYVGRAEFYRKNVELVGR
ncbi:MAG TPA: gamma carbonic anhydrase family protein, partial [Verrucomicrobiae bacterium]|nr:gamma carbonic anhydrase family protein [Verrucomicrobiae bacterium]